MGEYAPVSEKLRLVTFVALRNPQKVFWLAKTLKLPKNLSRHCTVWYTTETQKAAKSRKKIHFSTK